MNNESLTMSFLAQTTDANYYGNVHGGKVMKWIDEVAYALANKQSLISLEVKEGTTLKEAIEASGILEIYNQIDLSKQQVGIFSKFASLDTVLREKDRVEIYRPLVADPKEVRKERAAQVKAMRGIKKA